MQRAEIPVAADIITYRLGSKLVYVRPADDYEANFAQKEFPEELANVPRERISFMISAKMNGESRVVRISESAWVGAVTRLLRGEVIDATPYIGTRFTTSLSETIPVTIPQRKIIAIILVWEALKTSAFVYRFG
ncbi:hypothetical protein H0H81_012586 [Sphagnurus paluster]|uniref:Uncharacterized protein n=1 Tax=Sphagnurus paluster TaxID=117069 RepID=A0A9P7GNT9_9AGAR|nr:hypothetical protein H0H81_012586 [Sphagnurus paluster]